MCFMIKSSLVLLCFMFLFGCKKNHQTVLTVYNDGYQGYNAAGLVTKESNVLNQKPGLVILMIGSNDVYNPAELPQYNSNVLQIINAVRKTGSKVLIMTPPEMDTILRKVANEKLDSLSIVIKNISVQNQCYFFDVHKLFKNNKYETNQLLFSDGLHPDSAGYKLISDSLFYYMQKQNLTTIKIISCFGDSITFGKSVKGEGTSTGDTYPALLKILLAAQTGNLD